MFIIGGNTRVCPKGFICVNNYNLLLILIVLIVIVYLYNKQSYLSIYNNILENKIEEKENKFLDTVLNKRTHPPKTNFDNTSDKYDVISQRAMIQNNNDTKTEIVDLDQVRLNNRLLPPLSRNQYMDRNGLVAVNRNQQTTMGVPINIETRGSGGDFQQVGILSKNDISEDSKTPGNNTDSNILPLYGKPLYRGASKWLYYTETDKLNPIKIPITVDGRDCTDDQGCSELYDGSEVTIPSYNGKFKVKIYKFNKPRYIPYI